VLSEAVLDHLRQQPGGWAHGGEVVLKVQHSDVQRLMGSDLRNMGRVARFMRGILPFDVLPVRRGAARG
jgi:aarF domain-containing kinase